MYDVVLSSHAWIDMSYITITQFILRSFLKQIIHTSSNVCRRLCHINIQVAVMKIKLFSTVTILLTIGHHFLCSCVTMTHSTASSRSCCRIQFLISSQITSSTHLERLHVHPPIKSSNPSRPFHSAVLSRSVRMRKVHCTVKCQEDDSRDEWEWERDEDEKIEDEQEQDDSDSDWGGWWNWW